MGSADTAARVAVEVLVEMDVVAEVWVVLVARLVGEDWPSAVLVFKEYPRETRRELVRDIVDRSEVGRASRARDAKIVAVIVMKLLQRLDDEEVHREPDRPSPVGVSAEEAAVGLRRLIANREVHAIVAVDVGLFLVSTGQRSNTVRREKLRFVEQPVQELLHAMAAQ